MDINKDCLKYIQELKGNYHSSHITLRTLHNKYGIENVEKWLDNYFENQKKQKLIDKKIKGEE